MEHWRLQEDAKSKHILLVLSSITLGGCAIWCTHFTGMSALSLVLDDGTILAVNFELGLTLLSFLLPTFGVWVGLRIASTDPFFLEMQATRRRDMMVTQPKRLAHCPALIPKLPLRVGPNAVHHEDDRSGEPRPSESQDQGENALEISAVRIRGN